MAKLPAVILNEQGDPISPEQIRQARARGFAASLSGSAPQFFPYDAANWSSTEMGDWLPWIRSPDTEINLYRDRMVARTRDLVRNDGWAAGIVSRILDSTIGAEYRLIANPDVRALGRQFTPAFDAVWADEFRQAAEALWRSYANDPGHYNDVGRQLTISQQFRLALRHKLIDGESLTLTYWKPDRIGRGAASFATCYQIVDPDRLSNPQQMVDTKYLRGGVEIDDDGVPLAYHIRRAHQNDYYNAVESMEWERVPREDADGFQRVNHDFERDRAAQNRGVSIFVPVLSRLKMLSRYYGVELQAATISSILGTFITSPFDQQLVQEALTDGSDKAGLGFYQDLRTTFHDKHKLMLNDVRIPTLAPGEDIKTVAAARPNESFSPFTHEMLRTVAAVTGASAEQVHNDYSESSWSSARAGIVEAEKTYIRRLAEFNIGTATPVYGGFLHEAMDRGLLPLPRRAPDYIEARYAYSRSRWLGAGRGWVDPVAERQGAVLGLDAAFSTLEQECAKQGLDWEENLEQRAREMRRMEKLKLPRPEWMGADVTATQAAKKPEAQ